MQHVFANTKVALHIPIYLHFILFSCSTWV